ncbi:hypothetical protein ACHAXT_005510 [Thalassiosira profunda]
MPPRPLLIILALAACPVDVALAFSSAPHRHAATFVPPSASTAKRRRAHHVHQTRSSRQATTHLFANDGEESESEVDDELGLGLGPFNWRQDLPGSSSFAKYGRPQDINSDSFGPLLPIAEAVDEATGGWGLSYADLHPATPRTTVGQAFLATNFFYAAAGLWLGWKGDWFYGGLTELAGIVSFVYHYTQLEFGKNRSEVRLALLIDYFCAGSALITGGVYMIQAGITSVPLEAVVAAGGAMLSLSLCWVWEFGYPYILWHSVWHILSAYTGFLVGQDHLSKMA